MSIMPEQNLLAIQKQTNSAKKQFFKSNIKLFKLTPIQNHKQPKSKHKVPICDNNLLMPEALNELQTVNKTKNVSATLFPSMNNNLFSNSTFALNHKTSRPQLCGADRDPKQNGPENGISKVQLQNKIKQKIRHQFSQQESSLSSNSLRSSQVRAKSKLNIQNLNINEDLVPKNEVQSPLKAKSNAIEKTFTLAQYRDMLRLKIRYLLERIPFQIFITVLTICSLFMEDLRSIFIEQKQDLIIDVVNIFFLSAFFIEIMMSLTVESYAFSFFFYLDVISTVSICMDITLVTDLIYDRGGNSQQLHLLITQSKASRAAARAVRIMKIFRLARVVKLYKSAIKTKQLNELKQKQLLKQKLKAKQKYKKNDSGFMNENFEGQTSEYKLSFTNSLSVKDKQYGMSEKSQKSIPNLRMQNSNLKKRDQKTIKRQNVEVIDKINEQPQDDEQGSQDKSNRMNPNDVQNQKSPQNTTGEPINHLQLSKQQSNISKILSDSTIKKIIIVILIIMFSMTALDINNYYPENTSWDFLTQYVAKLILQPNVPISLINKMIQKKIEYFKTLGINSQIIAFQTPFKQLFSLKTMDYSQLRITQIGLSEFDIDLSQIMKIRPQLTLDQDFILSQVTSSTFDSITVVISYKSYNQIDAWFSMGKIVFICLTIIYLLQSFNTNISDLIVTPIQKMLEIIINPDKKIQQDEEVKDDFKEARYETLIVQKAIVKIRGLMSTIFGRVGMDLVYNQLFKSQNITATNYLSVKKKSFCIYGICRIQNYVQISQTLKSDTFTFVNQIAHIVHSSVYRYGGYGVKNLNDGFLVVFKLPEGREQEIIEQAQKSQTSKQKKNSYLNVLCDFGLYSFIKMIVRFHKQPKLLPYKKDQRIMHKFGNNFQIQMNFSLGIGESIEGMVGSQFKIDPIFLGGKLDQITKLSQVAQKYPNLIIMQKQFYENLTGGLKDHCRIIDYIHLNDYDQGNTQIYGVDLDLQYISPSRRKADKKKQEQPDIHLKKLLNMQNLKDDTQINNYYAQEFINSKKQLREVLRKKISDEMRKRYQVAFQTYIAGDWAQAKENFQEIMRIVKEDVLSKRIYNYMAQRGFKYTQNNCKQYKSVGEF